MALDWPSIIAVVISLLLLVILTCISRILWKSKIKSGKKGASVLIVMGSGGHTSEMIKLISGLDLGGKYSPVHFLVDGEDVLSQKKIRDLRPRIGPSHTHLTRRSRKVGQSYVTSVWTTIIASYDSYKRCIRIKPDLVICNGPGTCVPICLMSKLICRSMVVFVESFCRVNSLSLTGKILYFVADHFIVHWPTLKSKYSRSKYLGPGLVWSWNSVKHESTHWCFDSDFLANYTTLIQILWVSLWLRVIRSIYYLLCYELRSDNFWMSLFTESILL